MIVKKKKYIIELPENTHWIQWIMEGTKDHHPYMDYKQVEDLTPYTEPDLEQVRKEAYEKGYETAKHECEDCPKQAYTDAIRMEGYQKGLSDAWDVARKIYLDYSDGGYSNNEVFSIFGGMGITEIYQNLSASEAIEKIQQDVLRQNIQTIVNQCGYSLDEIAEVLKKMREDAT